MNDLADTYTAQNKFEKLVKVGTRYAGMAFMLPYMNTATKSMSSMVAMDRIIRTARALTKFSQAGLDGDAARLIAGEAEHFEKVSGLWLPNTDKWKNPQARDIFQQALQHDIDVSIISPNPTDKPKWLWSDFGSMIGQFHTFAIAANQRILLAGLQHRDMATLNGWMAMVGLGMLGRALADYAAYGEVNPNRTTAQWINEGLTKAGNTGYFTDLDAIWDKASGGHGIGRMLTGQPASRYSQQGFLEQALGPTAATADNLTKSLSGFLDGKMDGSDVHNGLHLLPFRNAIGFRRVFDELEKGLDARLGVPYQNPKPW